MTQVTKQARTSALMRISKGKVPVSVALILLSFWVLYIAMNISAQLS